LSAAIRLGRLAPCIPVSDVGRAVAFYESVFGMQKTFENGDPVSFVVLTREHVASSHNVMHLIVDGADELYRRCQAAAGARIVGALRDAPWGMRTFVVADPDGNCIDVGQPL
jgi:predicted enzyme related to lactoylglutathione lyase